MIKLNEVSLSTVLLLLIVFTCNQPTASQLEPAVVTEEPKPRNRSTIYCRNDIICDSAMFGSRCMNELCECPPNYIPTDAKRMIWKQRCLRADKGTPLYSECSSNEECQMQNKNSICQAIGREHICQCMSDYSEILAPTDIRCGRYIAERCRNDTDCNVAIENSECQLHGGPSKKIRICFCKEGYKYNKEHSRCNGGENLQAQISLVVPLIIFFFSLIVKF